MTSDLFALLAAGMVALQMAFVVLRRAQRDESGYLVLLGADLLLLLFVRGTHRDETLLAFVAEVVAAVLTFAPRLCDRLEGRAAARDQLGAALRVAMIRELIVPGPGSARRKRQLQDLIDVRARGSAEVARRLVDQLARVQEPAEAEALHEELTALLLVDQRYLEGVEHFERHLGLAHLGRRPGLLPHLVRAYGELGRLEGAATLLVLVEGGPLGAEPAVAGLVARARLTFLAYVGALAALGPLLAGAAGAQLLPRERHFLLELARRRAGSPPPAELVPIIELVAAHAAESRKLRARRPARVTLGLIVVNTLAFAGELVLSHANLGAMLFGSGDDGALIRAGALFRPAVHAGEWWRALSAMFLHADLLHLGVNMYGLYLLGRFTEEVCGPWRYFIIYVLGGLVGAAASTLVGAGPLSVGASGAIMGLLGALIVILILRRGSWPEAWRRALLWNLVLLGGLQIYIGFQVPLIDNAAHVGGMLGGAVAAALVAPGLLLGDGRAGRVAAIGLAASCAALLLLAGIFAVRTSVPSTLARLPTRTVTVNGVALTVPSHWEVDVDHGRVVDPFFELQLGPTRVDDQIRFEVTPADDPRFTALVERVERSARAP